MFERLLNLDVELRCLATKAFVAKEDIVDKVRYPLPKKNKKDEDKKAENSKTEEKPNIKETFDSLGTVLEEASKTLDPEKLKELEQGLKNAIEDINSEMKKSEKKEEKPEVIDVNAVEVVKPEPVKTGMDFSALQEGVTYEGPKMNSGEGRPVTPEDLEIALKNMKDNQVK